MTQNQELEKFVGRSAQGVGAEKSTTSETLKLGNEKAMKERHSMSL